MAVDCLTYLESTPGAGPSPMNPDAEDPSVVASLPEEGPAVATTSLPKEGIVIWQVEYVRDNQSYWWDLPAQVCISLERARTNLEEDVIWVWCWNPRDEPERQELSRYLLDPHEGFQRNMDTNFRRHMRRMVVLSMEDLDDLGPTQPSSTEEVVCISDTDMAPVTALDAAGPSAATSTEIEGYFVLPTWRSVRPRNDIYVKCPVCRAPYLGQDLRSHEEQHHTFQDFHCNSCAMDFGNSVVLRQHSRSCAHSISTKYVYRYCPI